MTRLTLSRTSCAATLASFSSRNEITTTGMSMFGKRSTPSRVNANSPTTVSERIRTQAKTGRLTHSSASHCMASAPDLYSRAVLEPLEAADHHTLARGQAGRRFDPIAFGLTGRDQPFLDAIGGDHEHAI